MRSPLRPVPAAVERWTTAVRVLRWLAALAALVAALSVLVRPLRTRWRPLSGAVALVKSARLAPGDHAWYVRPGRAERVLVTARHRTRIVIVRLGDESS